MNREVERIIEKLGSHNSGIISCVGALTEMGVVFEEIEGEGSEQVKWCEERLQECLGLEENVTDHIAALEELKRHIIARSRTADDDGNGALVETFSNKVNELGKKHSEAGPKRFSTHPKYKSYKQKVWHVHHPNEALPGDDSDFVVTTTQEQNLKCPITRTLLQQPVTNKSCGHHYSKAPILEMLKSQKKGGLTCPVTGCSAKVNQKSLEDDKDLELLIQREIEKQQNADSEEDDDVIDI
jgi:rRNA maturation protein Nop10